MEELGAKAFADSGSRNIPQNYVLPKEKRFCSLDNISNDEIPIIDLKCFQTNGSKDEQDSVVKQVAAACESYGFFQVINHGVDKDVINRFFEATLEFFSLTPEEKQKYCVSDKWKHVIDDPYGLFSYGVSFKGAHSRADDWRDWARIEGFLAKKYDAFPDNPPSFKKAAIEYEDAVSALDTLLLGIISQGLGLEEDYLKNAFGEVPRRLMVLNCYPPCPSPEAVAGISSHSDPLGFTVLAQNDVPGLEVKHGDRWISVKPIPDAFVINLGDMMQIFSNGRYKSAEHRARANSDKLRMSIGSFVGPSPTSIVQPITKLVNSDNPPRYKSSTCSEYMDHFYTLKLAGKSSLDYVSIPSS